jgi:hypothetical protein
LLTRLIALPVLSGAGAGRKKTAAIRQKQEVRFLADVERMAKGIAVGRANERCALKTPLNWDF